MKWRKITINTSVDAVDLICDKLAELGIEGVEIIDNLPLTKEELKQMYVDIPLINNKNDDRAKINCYIDLSEDIDNIINQIDIKIKSLAKFINLDSYSIELSETEDKDWINNWKEFFKPFRINENIIIKPSWEELDEVLEDDIIIEIDPGVAFGTGSHETTKLCITSLKKLVTNETKLLDIGSGSGILSIIAKKLGASKVLGVDIDENATKAAIENASLNNIKINKDNFYFSTANIFEDNDFKESLKKEYYDIVVANILADIIMPLSKIILPYMKKDGLFISSGIINTKEDIVRETLIKNGYKIIKTNKMGEWISFVSKKI